VSDTGAVEALYFALLDAWNRRDAAGMAALYAEDGVQIGFDGSRADGSGQVRDHLAPIFRDHPTARFVAKVRDCRLLNPDTALLTAVAGMIPPGSERINPPTNAVQTLVASRSAGEWRVELFQNTPAAWHGRDTDRAALTAELPALVGDQR
jgi:uncharacterized protein (TIGR02246 family)